MTASFASQYELPIVLTATIVPNVGDTPSINLETRLAEYIEALKFYLQYAPVIFLENSDYPLERHAEFREPARLQAKRFPPSASPERGFKPPLNFQDTRPDSCLRAEFSLCSYVLS
jgi:hypothetical protein